MRDRYILDDKGQPEPCPDLMTWGRWFETAANRVVASDYIGDVHVSTVFLGMDHRFTNSGLPILWETMIFGGPHDGYCDRYTSADDAIVGHATALNLVHG